MPKYFNNTPDDICIDNLVVKSHEILSTYNFIKSPLPAGLEELSIEPLFNFILLDRIITEDTIISIGNDFSDKDLIDVEVVQTTDDIRIFIQDESNVPGFLVSAGSTDKFQVNIRTMKQMIFKFQNDTLGYAAHIRIWKRT